MVAILQSTDDTYLDEWLAEYTVCTERTLITDHQWAQTYRLSSADQTLYLKILPESQRSGMWASAELGRHFAGIVPQVVALEADRGFLLLQDHGGFEIGKQDSHAHRLGVLQTYAKLQADCLNHRDLLSVTPKIDFIGLSTEFCRFLSQTDTDRNGYVGAAHFLGADRARFYLDRFSARATLLQQAVQQATRLPVTVNHCDLRMQNTAVSPDGDYILFDWDEVVAGPAGMSLHNFFSGCSSVIGLSSSESDARHDLLEAYITTLTEAGYASRDEIRASLPGAMCAGVMRYLMSYGKFPMPEEQDREQVAKILVRRLDDLLMFCDLQAIARRETIECLIDDYEEADAPEHARQLLKRYLDNTPDDVDMQLRLSYVHRYIGDMEAAEKQCRHALELAPAHPEFRKLLGKLLIDRLAIDQGVEQLRLAATFAPDDPTVRSSLDDALLLQELDRHAARPGCVPTIRISDNERVTGTLSNAKRRLASRLFREYGTLVVENVFEPTLLDQLAGTFEDRYRAYLGDDRPADALKVGNQRFMITVDVADIFNTPDLYAAPALTTILARLLGDDFILGSFTAVTSLPGAADMRMHKDHPRIFDEDELPGTLPTVGVTTLIPLKGFDLTMGTTRVVKGSHRASSTDAAEMEYQDPVAPKGSCLLMDYRLSHQGLANRSKFVRPVLSLVYNRPWFRDCVNYQLQEPLRIPPKEFDQVPEKWRRLFSWIRH